MWPESKEQVFGLLVLVPSQTSDTVCLPQKRKVEPVPLAPQVSPVTPVPSLPSSTEASQAAVFPAARETNTFKSREDHDQLASLTTVKSESSLFFPGLSWNQYPPAYVLFFNINVAAERHCPTTRPLTAREEKESKLWASRWGAYLFFLIWNLHITCQGLLRFFSFLFYFEHNKLKHAQCALSLLYTLQISETCCTVDELIKRPFWRTCFIFMIISSI